MPYLPAPEDWYALPGIEVQEGDATVVLVLKLGMMIAFDDRRDETRANARPTSANAKTSPIHLMSCFRQPLSRPRRVRCSSDFRGSLSRGRSRATARGNSGGSVDSPATCCSIELTAKWRRP